MKVLFFSPELKDLTHSPPFPLGLLSICSYVLKNSSHEVRIVDRTLSQNEIEDEVQKYSPDIVGISVLSEAVLNDAIYISQKCKALGLSVVWGGHFATACKDLLIKEDYIDAISIGRGEVTWLNILDALEGDSDFSNVPALIYKLKDKIILNKENDNFSCDEFPRCDFNLVDVNQYFSTYYDDIAEKMIWVFAKKGCYCQCTFCCNKAFNHQKVLSRPYEVVCDEIRELVEIYGADAIYFGDELWCSTKEQMRYQCDMLANLNLDFCWGCTIRSDILDYEDYKYMYDHGCRWILFGIESGDPERIKSIKKGVKLDNAVTNIRDCYNAGILPTTSFILGFPDETVEELTKTVALLKELSRFAILDIYYYTPYLGSEMYEQLVEEGRLSRPKSMEELKVKGWNTINSKKISSYSDISKKDLKVICSCALFWNTFYRRKKSNATCENNDLLKEHGFVFNLIFKSLDVFKKMFKNYKTQDRKLVFRFFINLTVKYSSIFYYSFFFFKTKKKYNIALFK